MMLIPTGKNVKHWTVYDVIVDAEKVGTLRKLRAGEKHFQEAEWGFFSDAREGANFQFYSFSQAEASLRLYPPPRPKQVTDTHPAARADS